jgi:desulfoferrodoxin (superoxide reductase-like protein)
VTIPLTVSVEHPMEPEHYIRSLEVALPTDPVPAKGVFRFTHRSGRASVSYQIRSGQGGDLRVTAECSRHGRFAATQTLRVAPGGCALPAGGALRERGGSATVRVDERGKPGAAVAVWTTLRHGSHTGLGEKNGQFVQERPPFYVERVEVFVGDGRVSEFLLTPAVSPDPRLRFFVRGDPARPLRVVFHNNRGERWEATQRPG